jgi:hypothetical protein
MQGINLEVEKLTPVSFPCREVEAADAKDDESNSGATKSIFNYGVRKTV